MTEDPDAAAKALHAASRWLAWIRWEQLSEGSRDEYWAEAKKAADDD